jgi:hypothetical protein
MSDDWKVRQCVLILLTVFHIHLLQDIQKFYILNIVIYYRCGKQLRELALSWCMFVTDTGIQ